MAYHIVVCFFPTKTMGIIKIHFGDLFGKYVPGTKLSSAIMRWLSLPGNKLVKHIFFTSQMKNLPARFFSPKMIFRISFQFFMQLNKLPETVNFSNRKANVDCWIYSWVMLQFGQCEIVECDIFQPVEVTDRFWNLPVRFEKYPYLMGNCILMYSLFAKINNNDYCCRSWTWRNQEDKILSMKNHLICSHWEWHINTFIQAHTSVMVKITNEIFEARNSNSVNNWTNKEVYHVILCLVNTNCTWCHCWINLN